MNVNKKNMRLWVAALRSGQYPQGTGALKKIDVATGEAVGYCCLGVECELAIADGTDIRTIRSECKEDALTATISFDAMTGYLPPKALQWLGSDIASGPYAAGGDVVIGIDSHGAEITAVMANDGLSWRFEQIADAIEKHYKLLEPDDEPVPAS